MIIHEGYENLDLKSPVVALGIFDGVHIGHRFLIDIMNSRAKEINGESVAVTFHPHPRLVLDIDSPGLRFLSTFEEKVLLLERTGIDHLVIIEFNREFSRMKACDFVRDVLVSKIHTKHLILGHDHHFGFRGEGNFETIKDCAKSSKIVMEQVTGFQSVAGIVSSSVIREELLKGNPVKANELLGYCYSIKGIVTEGKKLGRKLGFPTANIIPGDEHKLIPSNGVYAVEVMVNRHKYKGMLNIGTNPTINQGDGARSIEVNIFNFDRNIYGEEIEIIFRFRIRDEQKFSDIRDLSDQMKLDKEIVLKSLA
jgi:riboflavin kinase / FMN adenylyltransferase